MMIWLDHAMTRNQFIGKLKSFFSRPKYPEPFYICRGQDSDLKVFSDEYGYWLLPVKKNYHSNKYFDTFKLEEKDIERLYEWINRPVEDFKDDDSIIIGCGCCGECKLLKFILWKDKETTAVLCEVYVHASMFGMFKKHMASEVAIPFFTEFVPFITMLHKCVKLSKKA